MTEAQARVIAAEVDARLRAKSDEACRRQNLTYFPSAMEILGVRGAVVSDIARDIGRRLRHEKPSDVIRAAKAIIGKGTMDGRQVAYLVIAGHRPTLDALGKADALALGRGMDNWASVDTFSVLVAGQAWRRGGITDATIARWARSRDVWWRRAALVSTVALNQKSRGGTGDARRTLAVCRVLAADHEDMVVKAMSWALRALSAWDRPAVQAFLARHDQILHARVKREVKNKLSTGLKNPRP